VLSRLASGLRTQIAEISDVRDTLTNVNKKGRGSGARPGRYLVLDSRTTAATRRDAADL